MTEADVGAYVFTEQLGKVCLYEEGRFYRDPATYCHNGTLVPLSYILIFLSGEPRNMDSM